MNAPADLTQVQAFALTEQTAALAKPSTRHVAILGYGTSMTVCGIDALRVLRDAVDYALTGVDSDIARTHEGASHA